MICINEAHYPMPERPNALTADPRLHDYEHPEPCEYACPQVTRRICGDGIDTRP